MKNLTFYVIFLLVSISLYSQNDIEITIQVIEPYPVELEAYLNNPDHLIITVTNTSSTQKEFYYQGRIVSNNGIDIFTLLSSKPLSPVRLQAGQTIFYNVDAFGNDFSYSYPNDFDISSLTPEQDNYITFYRALPEGTYQICLRALDWNTDNLIGQSCSNEFTITYADAPEIVAPVDDEIVPTSYNSHIFIQWIPPFSSSGTGSNIVYSLKMIDITDTPDEDLVLLFDDPGIVPVLDQINISNEFYNYDVPPENFDLIEGHHYAVRVRAEDLSGTLPVSNNGYSEVSTFWYGNDGSSSEEDQEYDCVEGCHYTENIDNSPATSASAFSTIKIGYFKMTGIEFTNDNGNNASGTGHITIPFLDDLQVKVEFSGIQINNDGRMFGGVVTTVEDYSYDPNDMTTSKREELRNLLRNGRTAGIIEAGEMGLPVGLIQNISGYNFALAFTSMSFTPTGAVCQILQNLHIPAFGPDGWMTFSLADACLTPAGLGGEYYLLPVRDYSFHFGENELKFMGSTSGDPTQIDEGATYFQMDCNGLKKLELNGKYYFSENTLVKENDNAEIIPGKVVASFNLTYDQATGIDENVYAQYHANGLSEETDLHFVASLTIDPFQIKNLEGWGFEVVNAWIDYSDFENPPDMIFPANYDGDTDELWTGLYIKKMNFKTPPAFLNDKRRESIEIQNMIIDPLITTDIAVVDLLGINDGAIDGWAFSINSLHISIVQNNLEEGGFSGQLGTPLTKEGQYFYYSAIIDLSGDTPNSKNVDYTLTINPVDEFEFPFLVSKIALADNSYVMAKLNPGNSEETYFELHFEGVMGVNTELFNFDEDNPGIPLKLPVMDFSITYNSKDGFPTTGIDKPVFGFGEWENTGTGGNPEGNIPSFDPSWGPQFSRQEFGGFPLNIENMELQPLSLNEVKFKIEPHVSIATGQSGIGGSVGIDINSTIQLTGNTKSFKLQSMNIGSLDINTDVYGVQLEGSVEFYNDLEGDGAGSKGARGDLAVMLPVGFGATMAADFGMQVTDEDAPLGTAGKFNYWYLDGMIYLPTGIPIGNSGLGVYGFGGGLYVNMSNGSYDAADQNETNSTLENVKNMSASTSTTGNDVVTTGVKPTPAFQSYGLKLATTLGTFPSPLMANMDVSLYGEFSEAQGINMLSLSGDVFLFSPITDRGVSSMWANANLNWEKISSDHQMFYGGMDLYLDMNTLTGRKSDNKVVNVDYQVEVGGDNIWFLYAGDPREDNYGTLRFDFPGMPKIKGRGYFMAGYNLPDDIPIPEQVEWLMQNPKTGNGDNALESDLATAQQRDDYEKLLAQNANGMAFGAQLDATFDVDALLIYASMTASLGFDMNITQSDTRTCYISSEGTVAPGINGWYARGQVYAGLEGDIGLRFKFAGKNRDINLFYLAAAVMISGGGPNPEWIEGRAGIRYSVLEGTFSGNTTFDLTIGQKCVPDYEDPFAGLEIIYDTYPADEEENVSIFLNPSATFVLPIDKRFTLPIIAEDGTTSDQTYELSLHKAKIKPTGRGNNFSVEDFLWDDAHTQVSMEMDQLLSELSDYELTIEVRGYEINNGQKNELRDENGNIWKEKRTVHFTTGEAPYPIPDNNVVRTSPIRNQRYFLQDEPALKVAQIIFDRNMKDNDPDEGYFPESNDKKSYEYFWRFQDLNGGEPIIKPFVPGNSVTNLVQSYPEFNNNTIYSVQLVRKTTLSVNRTHDHIPFALSGGVNDTRNQMSSSWNITPQAQALDPGKLTGPDEDLIYQFYFKTSKYNTLEEKMETMTITTSHAQDSKPANDFPVLSISGDEGFDVYDILGEFDKRGTQITEPLMKFLSEENPNLDHSDYPFSSSMANGQNTLGNNNFQNYSNFQNAGNTLWQFAGAMHDTYIDMVSPVWLTRHQGITRTIEVRDNGGITQTSTIDGYEPIGSPHSTTTQEITIYPIPQAPIASNMDIDYEDLPLHLHFENISNYDDPLSNSEINKWLGVQINYNLGNGTNFNSFANSINNLNENNNSTTNQQQAQLTLEYDLHPKLRTDGKYLFSHGYDIYYNYYDSDLENETWQDYLDENFPDFLEAVNILESNLHNYWWTNNKGNYTLKIVPNKAIGDVFVGGTKVSKNFNAQ